MLVLELINKMNSSEHKRFEHFLRFFYPRGDRTLEVYRMLLKESQRKRDPNLEEIAQKLFRSPGQKKILVTSQKKWNNNLKSQANLIIEALKHYLAYEELIEYSSITKTHKANQKSSRFFDLMLMKNLFKKQFALEVLNKMGLFREAPKVITSEDYFHIFQEEEIRMELLVEQNPKMKELEKFQDALDLFEKYICIRKLKNAIGMKDIESSLKLKEFETYVNKEFLENIVSRGWHEELPMQFFILSYKLKFSPDPEPAFLKLKKLFESHKAWLNINEQYDIAIFLLNHILNSKKKNSPLYLKWKDKLYTHVQLNPKSGEIPYQLLANQVSSHCRNGEVNDARKLLEQKIEFVSQKFRNETFSYCMGVIAYYGYKGKVKSKNVDDHLKKRFMVNYFKWDSRSILLKKNYDDQNFEEIRKKNIPDLKRHLSNSQDQVKDKYWEMYMNFATVVLKLIDLGNNNSLTRNEKSDLIKDIETNLKTKKFSDKSWLEKEFKKIKKLYKSSQN